MKKAGKLLLILAAVLVLGAVCREISLTLGSLAGAAAGALGMTAIFGLVRRMRWLAD